jgi:hypothetical protein
MRLAFAVSKELSFERAFIITIFLLLKSFALHEIIASRRGQEDEVAARAAFLRAIGQADEILSKTAEFYSALDAKGLALCGLAITTRQVTVTLKVTVTYAPSKPSVPLAKLRHMRGWSSPCLGCLMSWSSAMRREF